MILWAVAFDSEGWPVRTQKKKKSGLDLNSLDTKLALIFVCVCFPDHFQRRDTSRNGAANFHYDDVSAPFEPGLDLQCRLQVTHWKTPAENVNYSNIMRKSARTGDFELLKLFRYCRYRFCRLRWCKCAQQSVQNIQCLNTSLHEEWLQPLSLSSSSRWPWACEEGLAEGMPFHIYIFFLFWCILFKQWNLKILYSVTLPATKIWPKTHRAGCTTVHYQYLRTQMNFTKQMLIFCKA